LGHEEGFLFRLRVGVGLNPRILRGESGVEFGDARGFVRLRQFQIRANAFVFVCEPAAIEVIRLQKLLACKVVLLGELLLIEIALRLILTGLLSKRSLLH